MDFAVWIDHAGYVRAKGSKVTRDDLVPAAQFRSLWQRGFLLDDFPENRQVMLYKEDLCGRLQDVKADDLEIIPGYGPVLKRARLDEALEYSLRLKKNEARKGRWKRTKEKIIGRWTYHNVQWTLSIFHNQLLVSSVA
jgi:hypothetical protein